MRSVTSDRSTGEPFELSTSEGGAAEAGASDSNAQPAAGGGAPDDAVRRPRTRRGLNWIDKTLRVPIGFLWLGVLAVLAVPVMIYMTLLYYFAQGTSALTGRNRGARADRSERNERVA